MESTTSALLESYLARGFNEVEGWVSGDLPPTILRIALIQEQLGVRGDIAEIGVHHGRFFLLLDSLRRDTEVALAADIFDKQILNVDHSGNANYAKFKANATAYSARPDGVKALQADSLTLSPSTLLSYSQNHGYRLISVDGGHTVEHTVNDLSLAAQVISEGGIVILDDYYNPDWPGVHEGFVKFMMHQNRNLSPFAYQSNKLFLCSISYNELYRTRLKEVLLAEKKRAVKDVWMSGFPAIAIR